MLTDGLLQKSEAEQASHHLHPPALPLHPTSLLFGQDHRGRSGGGETQTFRPNYEEKMAQQSLSERLKTVTTPVPPELFSKLITANHILHYNNVVDAYGHISVRNPSNPTTFFLSASVAPALVSGLEDLVEYKIEDATPVKKDAPRGYLERYIHSEIYKKYKGVQSVVHAHSEAVIPFSISSVPLKPVFHMGGVMVSHQF